MPEIDITGANAITYPELATWNWEVALYLFIGGVVAGLMIFNGVARLVNPKNFTRSLLVSDLAGLPLLGVGMFLLWLDLSNRWNFWRLFTTLQLSSPMSWGSWILLLAALVLLVRLLARIPVPTPGKKRNPFKAFIRFLAQTGLSLSRFEKTLSVAAITLGIGLGFYTGVLLSSIPARPLWNTAALAPLFLVSGITSGSAFLCLFAPKEEQRRLVPTSLLVCGAEALLILAFALTLVFGAEPAQRSGDLLLSGGFGWLFWLLVVVTGLVLPAGVEILEFFQRHLPGIPSQLPALLKITGGIALRFVVVFAGLQSFV